MSFAGMPPPPKDPRKSVTGATKLTLTLSNGKQAIYDATASGSKTLVFDYKVGLEDKASDLAVTKLNLNGAAIKDAAGNVLNITGVGINPTGKLVIDGYTGTSSAEIFNGTASAETFRGLEGNDICVVNNAGDVVVESASAGTDLVKASINCALASNIENLTLDGLLEEQRHRQCACQHPDRQRPDTLYGRAGADKLAGGSGAAIFLFKAVTDTTSAAAGSDTIIDFHRSQADKINLKAIDANPDLKNDQAFTFIDTQKFHKKAGELHCEIKNGDTFILGDIDGNGVADLSIRLDTSLAMKGTDFIL